MRIIIVALTTLYRENIRGTSALPYHLLKGLGIMNICPPMLQSPQAPLEGGVQSGSNQTPTQPPPLSQRGGEVPNAPFRGLGGQELAEQDVKCIIYTFNANRLTIEQMAEVERELGVEIRLLPLPRWYRWMFKLHLLWLRMFLRYPFVNYITLPQRVVEEIKAQKPDMIWVNGEELSRIVEQFPGMRRIQTGPDVESLYYYRMMGRRFVMNNVIDYWKCAMMYRKYARLERSFCTDDDFTYYAVGEADIEHLRQLNPRVHCEFLRHPHYEVAERGPIRFHRPKIKLLIAGQYNLYMQQTADEVLEWIKLQSPQETQSPQAPLKGGVQSGSHNSSSPFRGLGGRGRGRGQEVLQSYTITFLGKGWERHVEALRSMGVEVNHIKFAPDYIEEIIKHDIQVTPISIGTGTKGKVLDALANGLLVLGTPYAMENIAVEHGTSCMVWRTPQELLQVLQDIPQRIEHYEQMAEAGRQAVLERHSRHQIAEELFGKL